MEKNIKRFLSMALALIMVIGFLPMGSLPVQAEEKNDDVVNTIYRWELGTDAEGNPALCRVEDGVSTPLTPIGGNVTATKMSGAYFAIGETITLSRDEAWQIEWKATDLGTNGEKYMLLSNRETAYATSGHQGIYRNANLHGVHYYKSGNKFAAYYTSVDADAKAHVYLIKNVVTKGEDNTATNSVELYIDNALIGTLNSTTSANAGDTTYLQDNDLSLAYIGNKAMPLTNMKLDYLQITKTHIHDYAIEGETVVSSSCKESGYTVMSCECGVTKNVPNGIYGEHTTEWAKVNGKAVLKCTTCDDVLKSATYAWEKTKDENGAYYIKDVVTGEGVTTTDTIPETGVLTNYDAAIGYSITLAHDQAWTVEWRTSGAYWGMLLSKLGTNSTKNQAIFVPRARASVCINHNQNKNHPALVPLADYTDSHVYTLKNELVVVDGAATNEINLYVDGVYVSTVTEHEDYPNYIHTTDLVFNYIGSSNYPLTSMNLDYILVDIPAECDHTLGDWYVDGDSKVVRSCECGEKVETADFYVDYAGTDTLLYKGFDNLEDAFAFAAENGSTVCLNQDVTVEGDMVVTGNLNLNDHTLTVTGYVTVAQGGQIVDEWSKGQLKLQSAESIIFSSTNSFLPIWNGVDGYVFAKVAGNQQKTVVNAEANTVKYYFTAVLPQGVHESMMKGKDSSGVDIRIEMSWTKGGVADSEVFSCDSMVEDYYKGYDAASGLYKYAFALTVTGTNLVDENSLEFRPYFYSRLGETDLIPTLG